MKHLKVFVFLLSSFLIIVGCDGNNLTTDKAQRAVDNALDWTKQSGNVKVIGIREVSQENAAQADLRFDEFIYNADLIGTPVSKDQKPPEMPEPSSPNFYDQMLNFTNKQVGPKSIQVKARAYSSATMTVDGF